MRERRRQRQLHQRRSTFLLQTRHPHFTTANQARHSSLAHPYTPPPKMRPVAELKHDRKGRVSKWGAGRGGGDRQTDRQTDRQRDTDTEREADSERDRDIETDGERERERDRDRQTDRQRVQANTLLIPTPTDPQAKLLHARCTGRQLPTYLPSLLGRPAGPLFGTSIVAPPRAQRVQLPSASRQVAVPLT